jgi:TolA-binding protein
VRPTAGPRRTSTAAVSSASLLADQNNLFAAAVRARNHGLGREAATLFERLIDEYPASPLAESAAAQRMKVLSSIDATAGARAAADYLRRFPSGFARGEAQRWLEESPPR